MSKIVTQKGYVWRKGVSVRGLLWCGEEEISGVNPTLGREENPYSGTLDTHFDLNSEWTETMNDRFLELVYYVGDTESKTSTFRPYYYYGG